MVEVKHEAAEPEPAFDDAGVDQPLGQIVVFAPPALESFVESIDANRVGPP